jgi:hypothetical protein
MSPPLWPGIIIQILSLLVAIVGALWLRKKLYESLDIKRKESGVIQEQSNNQLAILAVEKIKITEHDNASRILIISGVVLIIICWFGVGQPSFSDLFKPYQEMIDSLCRGFFSNPTWPR